MKASNIHIVRMQLVFLAVIFIGACGKSDNKPSSIEYIKDINEQDSIFTRLASLTDKSIIESSPNDSLAFLILPIQASCPSCREKTIDSIIRNQDDLTKQHFIIISATGGYKTINAFFKEQNGALKTGPQIFLDSTNKAFKLNLYYNKPTIYYTYGEKAYKKVAAIPATVRQDLQEFFTGVRSAVKE